VNKQAGYYKKYRKARDRALSRLANAYPDDYKKLLEQEKANEQANDGDTGIAGTYSAGFVDTRSDTRVNATPEARNYGSNQGYNGGEA